MILDDIPQVVYAPAKVFKKIIENPKYLGAVLILVLFIGIQIGFEYVQFSKTYVENTSPAVNNLPSFLNATSWQSNSNVTLSNNYNDFYNYSVDVVGLSTVYSLFGNSSLEMDAANANNVIAALGNTSNVDCSAPSGFLNLSMTIKLVDPSVAPQSATLTLYSLSDTSSFQYDLTSSLSNTADIGLWNNLTIPLGQNAQGWTSSGSPSWSNITALQLTFNYPTSSNIAIRIGAFFFRGQYETPIQFNGTGIALLCLETFSLQFIFAWFVLTGVIYLFFKGLKSNITWKPLFIAVAFALFVMVIRAAVNLVAAATLPTVYYPFDLSLGVIFPNTFGAITYPLLTAGSSLSAQSVAILNSINSATAGFREALFAMFAVSYIWLGALGTVIIGILNPQFSTMKRVLIAAVSVGVTILLLLLLVAVV